MKQPQIELIAIQVADILEKRAVDKLKAETAAQAVILENEKQARIAKIQAVSRDKECPHNDLIPFSVGEHRFRWTFLLHRFGNGAQWLKCTQCMLIFRSDAPKEKK